MPDGGGTAASSAAALPRIIACIEIPDLIRRILTHLATHNSPARAPPQSDLLSA